MSEGTTETIVEAPADPKPTTTEAPIVEASTEMVGDANDEYKAAMKAAGVKMIDDDGSDDAPDLDKMAREAEGKKDDGKADGKADAKALAKDAEGTTAEEIPEFKMTLKVNGEETEYKDRGEIQKLAQMGLASDKKFYEATQLRDKAEGFLNQLKNDPISVLQNPSLGINFRELAENFLYEEIQFDAKSPEEQQAFKDSRELAALKRRDAAATKANEEANTQKATQYYLKDMTAKINTALSTVGLSDDQWAVSRMANYMRQALHKGIDVDPSKVAELVKGDLIKNQQNYLNKMDPEQLIKTIGAENVDRLRKFNVDKYQTEGQKPQIFDNLPTKEEATPTYSSMEEMREKMLGG